MEIGTSLFDQAGADIVPEIMELAKAKGVEITLPVDFVVSNKFGEDGEIKTATKAEGIPAGFMGLDCGPESIKMNAAVINSSKTIIWNGPMGVFEMGKFEAGTKSMMDTMVEATSKVYLHICISIYLYIYIYIYSYLSTRVTIATRTRVNIAIAARRHRRLCRPRLGHARCVTR